MILLMTNQGGIREIHAVRRRRFYRISDSLSFEKKIHSDLRIR